MAYLALKALHVLAVGLWVGGMAFAHYFLRPALATLEPPQRLVLMHGVLRRFFGAVLVAVLVILGSGVWMIGRAAAAPGFVMPADWTVMGIVGLLMMLIFGHIRFVLFRRMTAAVQAAQWPVAAAALASIRAWVLVNLVLGVALSAGVLVF